MRTSDPIGRPLALTITALLALIVAQMSPLMGLSVEGRHAGTTIVGGADQMWQLTAVIVAFCAVIAPAGYILFMLSVLLAARRLPAPHWVGKLLGWADSMQPWAMIEVMMLGILVALIKIAELATVEAGIGLYAVGALVLLFFEAIGAGLKTTLETLDQTIKDLDKAVSHIDRELTPALTLSAAQFRRALASADRVLKSTDATLLGKGAPGQQALRDALLEVSRAARSPRVLSDYLDRHPEALLRGKVEDKP